MTAAEFKKQINPILSKLMKSQGYKGSGFHYNMKSERMHVFVGLQGSLYSPMCYVELGIQPSSLPFLKGSPIDPAKLKYYDCAFRTRVANINTPHKGWEYSENEQENQDVAMDIFNAIKLKGSPLLESFNRTPSGLEQLEVGDLDDFKGKVIPKLGGIFMMTTATHLAWILTRLWENRDLQKSKDFAFYGLSKEKTNSLFMGMEDFKRVITK